MSAKHSLQSGWRRWLRLPTRSPELVQRDVDDELAFHLAMREEELRRLGFDAATASAEARRRFGDVTDARASLRTTDLRAERRSRGRRWWTDLRHDLVYAARRLLREPGFALVAVLTLALGIGATVAMTSVLRRLILAPLPYDGAERLVSMSLKAKDGSIRVSANPAVLEAWRNGIPSLERTEAIASERLITKREGRGVTVNVGFVAPGLLSYLKVVPVAGRGFLAEEVPKGAVPVAMLGENSWARHYGRDPAVIGSAITLGDRSYTIVGVMPSRFDPSIFGLMPRSDVWLPHQTDDPRNFLTAIGVMRDGATLEQLERDLAAALDRASGEKWWASLVPNVNRLLESDGQNTRSTLYLMSAAVFLVLLIGCINVANLLLARGAAREREMSVRGAIGASRGRLLRQLLAESFMLALLGAMAGAALSRLMLAGVIRFRPVNFAALDDVRIDGAALLVALGTAFVTAIVFGFAPAVLGSGNKGSLLQGGARNTGTGRAGQRLRRTLVFAEVACSTALVVAALLLVRSAQALDRMRLGYDVAPIVTMRVQRVIPGDSTPIAAHLDPALERLRALPGIEGVSAGDNIPGSFGACLCELLVEGATPPPEASRSTVIFVSGDTSYLRTAGTRILAGRGPAADSTEAAVTSVLARQLWPGADAIGKRFRMNREAALRTVVGIFEAQVTPEGWVPNDSAQVLTGTPGYADEPTVVIRLRHGASTTARQLAELVESAAPALRAVEARSLSEVVREARAPRTFTRVLLGAFAGCAVLLAALGLYGVMSYGVTQRTREIGVRMALGAGRGAIGRLIAKEGLVLTIAGLIAGGAGSVALTRMLGDNLIGVSRWDVVTYAGSALTMLAVTIVAVWVPVRRATRVDPVTAVAAE